MLLNHSYVKKTRKDPQGMAIRCIDCARVKSLQDERARICKRYSKLCNLRVMFYEELQQIFSAPCSPAEKVVQIESLVDDSREILFS